MKQIADFLKRRILPARLRVGDVGVIVCYAMVLTVIAWRVYPVWDDGWLQLLLLESAGPYAASRARPMELYLVDALIRRGWLLTMGVVLHLVGWSALGLASYGFWRLLFPERKSDALLAAVLSPAARCCWGLAPSCSCVSSATRIGSGCRCFRLRPVFRSG